MESVELLTARGMPLTDVVSPNRRNSFLIASVDMFGYLALSGNICAVYSVDRQIANVAGVVLCSEIVVNLDVVIRQFCCRSVETIAGTVAASKLSSHLARPHFITTPSPVGLKNSSQSL